MSRLLKLVASICVLVAGGGAAVAAGSARARTGSHMIICPLERGATITTPCCGPPVVTAAAEPAFVCCGTPQPINCPVELTASSSPNPSIAGQKVTISGRWSGGTSGQTVDLWQELPGAKTFTKVAHTTTGSLGDFQFVRKGVQTNRKWYVSVGSAHSLTIAQRVKAKVSLAGLNGRVSPNHSGERVLVEARNGSGWAVIARPRLSHASTFSIGPTHGEIRAVFAGDRRNIRSVSPPVVLHG
jgi:hypothetical protein